MKGPITLPNNSLAISSFASRTLSTPLVGVRNQTPRVRKAKSLTEVDVDWAAVCAGCFLHPCVPYGLGQFHSPEHVLFALPVNRHSITST